MGLRDILRKKEDITNDPSTVDAASLPSNLQTPEFRLVRSDTHAQEVIEPPSPDHHSRRQHDVDASFLRASSPGRSRSASVSSQLSTASTSSKARKRLSERLHLSRPRSSSAHVPQDLPDIVADGNVEDQWEKRATMLASRTEMVRSTPGTPTGEMGGLDIGGGAGRPGLGSRTTSSASGQQQISTKAIDDDIQEAIRLHEEGDLEKSTYLFGKLADPNGANNPLSQVLYGLALRHGWGCKPDVTKAVTYLTAAASNAAAVEQLALQAGLKKGGAAKGELVLAIFELGNSFRHGWGTEKDAVAAKQYYETAANLGDTDAMNETGWCYLEGFGCKKDKFAAARYYRLAETNGNKTLGNSWIWKEKYDPDAADKEKKKKKWL